VTRTSALTDRPRGVSPQILADNGTRDLATVAPVRVVEFAVKQLMRSDPAAQAVPAVLQRLTEAFGCQAAIAFELTPEWSSVQAHPAEAATEALIGELRALSVVHARTVRSGGSCTVRIGWAPAGTAGPLSALVAFSVPIPGKYRYALALITDRSRWDAETRSAIRTLASVLSERVGRLATTVTEAIRNIGETAGSEEGLKLLSRLAPVGIVQYDAIGQCVFVNDRWCEWTGRDHADALGGNWDDPIHPDDVDRVEAEALKALETGAELHTDCRLLTKDGEHLWVSAVLMALTDERGNHTGYLVALTDVSARKERAAARERVLEREQAARQAADRAKRELAATNDKLRELDEMKTQFLATVSHELRTPLTSIISFTDLILDAEESLSSDGVEFLGIIDRNAELLLRLVGDLLLLSKLESGVIALDLDEVSVADLVNEAVASSSVSASSRGVTLTGVPQAGPPARGDKLRLRQVIDNLVSNAVKFTHTGGRVTVRASYADTCWRIDVQDNGIGIPADELELLFGRFFRASNARAAGTPGTGIGLSIVKTVTELHGGHVEVSSAPGRGTTFSVFLPDQP
jgi:PAS domain S-box-containing protein